MAQTPTSSGGDPGSPAPRYYDLSAPLTRPVTTLQVTGFTLREGMLPSLIAPDGSLYFGPIAEDGKYRIPTGCGIIFFHHDETVPSTFIDPRAAAAEASSGGGFVSHFFSRGIPQKSNATTPETAGANARQPGQSAADFTALCKRYQHGDRYGGDWENGTFHGDGVLLTSFFTYQGGWKAGVMHGKGTITYTRKYVDSRPAASSSSGNGGGSNAGVGTLLLKGLSYVTPFELVATAAAPKEYFGDFSSGHGRHGSGLMRYYNGDVYEGEWQDNCRHGKGKLRKPDGEVYEGDWVGDERQGYGKILFPNGSLFKGLMARDQRNGEGVMRFANGDEYFGNFVSDRIEGHGTMKYRNGDVYDGAWHDQLRHGKGKYTLKRTGATMHGTFQNGLIHGEGTVIVPGVSTFVGTFVRGERTVGTMHWHPPMPAEGENNTEPSVADSSKVGAATATPSPPAAPVLEMPAVAGATSSSSSSSSSPLKLARKNYLCYQGEWHGEQMHGRGLLWYTNGDFFSGRFQKSLRHGPGNMRYAAEQAEFSGQFVNGIRHGLGLLQRADGSIRAGRWQQNLFVEGYEGEWDGVAFHGIGRLTIPLDIFFGLRASNSTLKLADVSAMLSDAASVPPVVTEDSTAAAAGASVFTAEDEARSGNGGRGVGAVSPTTAAAAAVVGGDALRRADLAPSYIDFFGVFRNGVRDGLGMLKLPALDCLLGGTLNLAEDRRNAGRTAAQNSNTANNNSNSSIPAGNIRRGKAAGFSTPPPGAGGLSGAAVPSVVIKGRWVKEVLHCDKGVLAFPNGVVYIGGFHNGMRHATCARVWAPDGSVMECGWSDDAPRGPGVWYQRNRVDPIYQTIVPSVLRRSRSRRVTEAPPRSALESNACTALSNNSTASSGGGGGAGDLFGLSYLWGLVGLGFGGSSDNNVDAASAEEDEEDDKPRRVLIGFQNHFAMACTWYPYAMDMVTYARVVLPEMAAQTAPLPGATPWPQTMHSSTMCTSMAPSLDAAGRAGGGGTGDFYASSNSNMMMSFAAVQQQQQQQLQAPAPSVRQIAAGAASLHLAEAPSKLAVGRANGPAVVYFESGVVLSEEWLSNTPRLAVPYRPWSAYDSFLVWQASRPAARNSATVFPLWVSLRSQSCYSALLAAAPEDVRGEPKRTPPGGIVAPTSTAFSPLAAWPEQGAATTTSTGAAAVSNESITAVTSPETRCTVCGKEYSFFRKRVHCTLCLRSTCSSCLGQMDADGQRQEDVKALLRHAYMTSEQTLQLAAAAAKSSSTNTNTSVSGGTARRVVFPSIPTELVERAFDGKNVSTVPVCTDCVRAMLWKLRFSQLWIPTSMFASVVDIDRHQRDMQMRRKASAQGLDDAIANADDNAEQQTPSRSPQQHAGVLDSAFSTSAAAGAGAGAAGGIERNGPSPLLPDANYSYESSRQVSTGSELLPVAQVKDEAGDTTPHDEQTGTVADAQRTPRTPTAATSGETRHTDGERPPDDSPSPVPPAATRTSHVDISAATVESAVPVPPSQPASGTKRYLSAPQTLSRPSGELLPPTQYITYCGYTSHSIPHVYGELWWGRRYYYRGGFCAGERHGFGVQYMPNGERYEGAFQRDAWHGLGVYYLEDGAVLIGDFKRGELHTLHYHGEVEESTAAGVRPHGRGVGYDADGSTYNGEWVRGQRHGTGMLHLPDGISIYSGTFIAGAMEGVGKLVTTSGAYYGDFTQNQQHGKGLLFTSNCVVEGSWVHGASNGFTRIYETATGEVYETTYRDGNERDDCFSAPMMVDDAEAAECGQCGTAFTFFLRRHHCRLCGDVFCDACTQHRATLPPNFGGDGDTGAAPEGLTAAINPNTVGQRVCDACFYRLTQRRMIGLRRYRDGGIYAGCWSQGRWVSRGLYCRPDGIFVVMDTHGRPLISADLARAKMSLTAKKAADAANTATEMGGEAGKNAGASSAARAVPVGGFGVSRRPARTMLPISPSILQDASPAKELLDNASLVSESSTRKDLDAFLLWWATTRSRCGLQVPLDVSLVSKYQRMPAQLLKGGKTATVAVGSDAATYLTCPARCTMAAPHTPTLAPIRLFVTLADARRAMQAMVEGEVKPTAEADSDVVKGEVDPGESAATPTPVLPPPPPPSSAASAAAKEGCGSGGASPASATSSFTSPPPRLTTEERRTIDSDVEAAALRASRFMPVAIPRAPTVPITPATAPSTAMAAVDPPSPLLSSASSTRDVDRSAETPLSRNAATHFEADTVREVGAASVNFNSGGGHSSSSGAFGLTAWATRPPPEIDAEDITDEKLMAMMRAERLAWAAAAATSSNGDPASPPPLMGPTPTPPAPGENNPIAWDQWTTHEVPRYAPPPLVPVIPESSNGNTPTVRTAPAPAQQPRSEVDLYFACPLWEPSVPDAQMLLEQGKMTQAAKLMRRLQREHQKTELRTSSNAGDGGLGEGEQSDGNSDEELGSPLFSSPASSAGAAAASSSSPSNGSLRGKRGGSLDALDVLQQMQAASNGASAATWAAGGLLSAEQRAQSGGGWAPAPMRGPFTFDTAAPVRRRSADGQRWCFKVKQTELSSFQ